MFRRTAWRKAVTSAVSTHQEEALNTSLLLLKSYGPTAFLLGEAGNNNCFKVFLGDPHKCSCSDFTKNQELCKHICWVLLCKFNLPKEHEYSFQLGLMERQLLELLQGVHRLKTQLTEPDPLPAFQSLSQPGPSHEVGSICRKGIQPQVVCPICQEELLLRRQPVSFCRFGCGNSVHISCMKVWANHQKLSDMQKMVKCPLCRANFNTLRSLHMQMRNCQNLFTKAERAKPDRHLGVQCYACQVTPVTGRCFKCTVCKFLYLCENCVKTHPQHPLASRTTRRKPWVLVENDSSDDSNEETCDRIVPEDTLPNNILEKLPSLKVRTSSRLLDDGQQCRICLHSFCLGQLVRTLPCFHKFHMDCADQILRTSNCCPLDGYVIHCNTTRVRKKGSMPAEREDSSVTGCSK